MCEAALQLYGIYFVRDGPMNVMVARYQLFESLVDFSRASNVILAALHLKAVMQTKTPVFKQGEPYGNLGYCNYFLADAPPRNSDVWNETLLDDHWGSIHGSPASAVHNGAFSSVHPIDLFSFFRQLTLKGVESYLAKAIIFPQVVYPDNPSIVGVVFNKSDCLLSGGRILKAVASQLQDYRRQKSPEMGRAEEDEQERPLRPTASADFSWRPANQAQLNKLMAEEDVVVPARKEGPYGPSWVPLSVQPNPRLFAAVAREQEYYASSERQSSDKNSTSSSRTAVPGLSALKR